ncbi:MAG: ABC transporter permease [Acetobacteraceae bacterium]|nr:ABC transporter permease [Acetobacteraceae bacterium]
MTRLGGPAAATGAAIVLLVVLCAIFVPLLAPYSPTEISMQHRLEPPSAAFLFGTDQAGRDVFSRVLWGARPSLQVGMVAVVIGLVGGVSLGLWAGYHAGHWLEQAVMRVLDATAAIPLLIWAIAAIGIIGVDPVRLGPIVLPNEFKVMVLLGFLYIPGLARLTHASAKAESRSEYVDARRLQGVPEWRIIVSDVLPNCLPPVIVQATLLVAVGIVVEAAVSFVGLGVQPPASSWGTMLAEARNYLFSGDWWLSLFPGLAISLTVIGFNLLGDGLRDVLDPRRNTAPLTA